MTAAVYLHEERPSTRDIWLYSGASAVGGFESDPLELSSDYQGSGVDLADPQEYWRMSKRPDLEAASSWQDLQPTTVCSIELTFGYHMHHTWGVTAGGIIVYADTGTGLNADWINGTGYLALSIARAQSELALLGESYRVRGVIMQIAAADANVDDSPLYGANLASFIGAHRAVWPDISFLIMRGSAGLTGEGYNETYVNAVRAATDAYVATDSNSISVDVDSVEFTGTGPHYLTPETETLGEIVATAASRLLYFPRRGGVVYSPP